VQWRARSGKVGQSHLTERIKSHVYQELSWSVGQLDPVDSTSSCHHDIKPLFTQQQQQQLRQLENVETSSGLDRRQTLTERQSTQTGGIRSASTDNYR